MVIGTWVMVPSGYAGPDFGFFLCTWQGPPKWQFPCLYSSVVEFRYPRGQSSLNHPGRHGICACSVVAGCFVPPVGPAGGSRELARWVKRLPGYLLRSPWVVQVPLLGAFEGPSTPPGPPCETPTWAPGQVPAHWPGAVRPYMWCAVGLVQDTHSAAGMQHSGSRHGNGTGRYCTEGGMKK